MKNIYLHLKLFSFGFGIAFLINLNLSCSEKESPTQPEENLNTEYTESQSMKGLSESLIAAFNSEDKPKVISYLNDEFKEVYAEILNNSKESLSAFGTALEKRKLIFANELYAEYEIIINEVTYTIAYVSSGSNDWQLMRF